MNTRHLAAGVASAVLLAAASPALATSQPMAAPVDPAGQSIGTNATADEQNDADWGWIGVVGLAGLAGLFRRRDRDTGAQRTTH